VDRGTRRRLPVSAPACADRIGPRDLAVIAGQLGRPPRDLTGIAARCPFGHPAVIETAPILTDGAPNPTLLYLTCPVLVTAVSGAEAEGAVKDFKSWAREDLDGRRCLEQVTQWYRGRRAVLAGARSSGARPDAGIGGPPGPDRASCLHAYAAALLAVMSGWLGESLAESAAPGAGTPPGGGSAPAALVRGIWERFLPPLEETWCRDSRCDRWAQGEKRAVIDVGTISVRLLVGEVVEGGVRTISRKAEVTRLGEGLQRGGLLSPAARQRTASVVARFLQEARSHDVDQIVLAGTSAVREALDGPDYLRSLGLDDDVIAVVLSGREEAEAAYAGASLDVSGDMIVLDIGGGSTELIRRSTSGAVESVSLELGASRATDRWIKTDPPTSAEIESVRGEAAQAVGRLRAEFGRDAELSAGPTAGHPLGAPGLVGVAGTVTTLACLDAGLEEYDAETLHLRTLAATNVRELLLRLSAMTTAQRAALPCVQRGRAPVIVAGAAILLAAMEALGYAGLTVSERDLLDGLMLRGPC
jgi:exopolyphosphatase/guanosine-5'-triphosphate,3'-diphosphate pyrophosphatase